MPGGKIGGEEERGKRDREHRGAARPVHRLLDHSGDQPEERDGQRHPPETRPRSGLLRCGGRETGPSPARHCRAARRRRRAGAWLNRFDPQLFELARRRCPFRPTSRKARYAQPVRSRGIEPRPEAAQSRGDGATDPRPRDPRGGTDAIDGRILFAACRRRADHQRGDRDQPRRAGLAKRTRTLERRAG